VQIAPGRLLIPCLAALLLWPLPWTGAGSRWASGELAAQPAAQERADRLQIERIGGVAGFGGTHLKSRGSVALSALSAADRQAVEKLFRAGDKADRSPGGDMFRYKITRETASGSQTIEVPENAVPESLRNSMKDFIE
jgi:hypothetical protein